MLRRRQLWLIAVAAMCAAAASATAAPDQGERKQVAFGLRIGNVLPFTGDLAAYGANLDRGCQARCRPRQRGALARCQGVGATVKLVASEDGQTQASASVEAATKLVKTEG